MRISISLFLPLLMLSLSSTAVAQEQDKVDTGEGVVISVKDGWRQAKAPKGAVALLKSTIDDKSQMEFRVAKRVGENAKRYFTTFHTSLQKSGMERKSRNEEATYATKKGAETEYELISKNRKFRLVVWEFSEGEQAWLIVGFFNASKRDRLYKDFGEILNALDWK